jgi:hypothetical protein
MAVSGFGSEWAVLMIVLVPALFLFTRKQTIVVTGNHEGERIRCLACGWEPSDADRWCCSPGCGWTWNTFRTRALCPGCDKQWTYTVCLTCDVASLHEAWYHKDGAF